MSFKSTTRRKPSASTPTTQRPNVRTRAAIAHEASLAAALLPLNEIVAANVARVSLLYNGESARKAAAVCKAWRDAFRDAEHVYRESSFGALKTGRRLARFDSPHSVSFLPSGDVVIADTDNFRLQVCSLFGFGDSVREILIETDEGEACPTGVCSVGSYIYVVACSAHKLIKMDRDGIVLAEAGEWGSGRGQLRFPWGCSYCAALDLLYVTDSGNRRVCIFDPSDLCFLSSFGSGDDDFGRDVELVEPRGCTVDGNKLFVADAGAGVVQCFMVSGQHSHAIGSQGRGPGRFDRPSGVAVRGDQLLVTEIGNARLQILSLDGLPLQIVNLRAACSGICVEGDLAVVTALQPEQRDSEAHVRRHLHAVHLLGFHKMRLDDD